MNKLYNLFLLINFINVVFCQDIAVKTNYTREYLLKSNEKIISCKTDNDCPEFYSCMVDQCQYGTFLCPEDEKKPCTFINTLIWNINKDKYYSDYKDKSYKPILKTCSKDQKHCSTEKCETNSDCYSDICESGICKTNETIYMCNPNKCGKYTNMKCNNNKECFWDICDNGYCKNDNEATSTTVKILTICAYILIALILIIIAIVIVKFKKRKN